MDSSIESTICRICSGDGRIGKDIPCWKCTPAAEQPSVDFLAGVGRQDRIEAETDLRMQLHCALRKVRAADRALARQKDQAYTLVCWTVVGVVAVIVAGAWIGSLR